MICRLLTIIRDAIRGRRPAHHGETIAEDEYLTRLAKMSRTRGGR